MPYLPIVWTEVPGISSVSVSWIEVLGWAKLGGSRPSLLAVRGFPWTSGGGTRDLEIEMM